jgi:hypothetical protein
LPSALNGKFWRTVFENREMYTVLNEDSGGSCLLGQATGNRRVGFGGQTNDFLISVKPSAFGLPATCFLSFRLRVE